MTLAELARPDEEPRLPAWSQLFPGPLPRNHTVGVASGSEIACAWLWGQGKKYNSNLAPNGLKEQLTVGIVEMKPQVQDWLVVSGQRSLVA